MLINTHCGYIFQKVSLFSLTMTVWAVFPLHSQAFLPNLFQDFQGKYSSSHNDSWSFLYINLIPNSHIF